MTEKVLIAGIGLSGEQAALLALQKNLTVFISDSGSREKLKKRLASLTEKGCTFVPPEEICRHDFDYAVISPGIDPEGEFGSRVYSDCRTVISEIEFAARFCKTPILGVTGTNGKTTTTEIITHCLKKLGKRCIAAGNIGLPLSQVVHENQPLDFIVCELSSFQLESIKDISLSAGVLLNISSDHADRYQNVEEYAAAKARLLKHSKIKIASAELKGHKALTGITEVKYTDFALQEDVFIFEHQKYDYKSHPLCGLHNAQNLTNVLKLMYELGFDINQVWDASLSYSPSPHRLQHFLSKNGIHFYNDSKATNPHALLMALKSLGNADLRNIVLIAGGRDKKMDFSIVNTALCSYVRKIFIYGECRSNLFSSWNEFSSCKVCEDFVQAVNDAVSSLQEGDILLLSPACASQDLFGSYAERGDMFIKLVLEWTENE